MEDLIMIRLSKLTIAGLLAFSAGSAFATDGTISFTGEILASTCEFEGSSEVSIELGHYGVKQFTGVGDKSPTTYFSIPLKNCPDTPWLHEDGSEDPSFRLWLETRDHDSMIEGQNLLAVTSMSGDAAQGVGIRVALQDGTDQGTEIKLDQVDDNVIPITGTNMNLDLQAYYVATVAPEQIKAGQANASVDVTFDYR
jgi:major type 1 subunit fimbrin (pilin)